MVIFAVAVPATAWIEIQTLRYLIDSCEVAVPATAWIEIEENRLSLENI